MKIAYNPKDKTLTSKQIGVLSNDIIFDLNALKIYAKGVEFKGSDTKYDIFKKTTKDIKGYNGLVPAPDYNDNSTNRFLREDGKWYIPVDNKVSLIITTTNNKYPLVLGYLTITDFKNCTLLVYTSSNLYANPNTGTLYSKSINTNIVSSDTNLQFIAGENKEIQFKCRDTTHAIVLNTTTLKPFNLAKSNIDLGSITDKWKTLYVIDIQTTKSVKASQFIVNLGKKTLFLKADGSLDSTTYASKSYVDTLLSANDAMVFKSVVYKESDLPLNNYLTGWTYKVGTAGIYLGQRCEVGDTIICITDAISSQQSINNNHWNIIQTNIDGAVLTNTKNPENSLAIWTNNSNVLSNIEVLNNTTLSNIKWSSSNLEDNKRIINLNSIAYWDGSYSSNISNLQYLNYVNVGRGEKETNTILAAPSSGSGTATFRKLEASDLPNLFNSSKFKESLTIFNDNGLDTTLYFLRNSYLDSYYDWRILNTSGKLNFDVNNNSGWYNKILLDENLITIDPNLKVNNLITSKKGFYKIIEGVNNSDYLLKADGGHKAVSDFAPKNHSHILLTGWSDERGSSTSPSDYYGRFLISGYKDSLGLPDGGLAGLLGFKGWTDSTGDASHELAFTSNGNIYLRYGLHSWSSWRRIAYTTDIPSIPTVTAYYWANINISNLSNSNTSPTFGYLTSQRGMTCSGSLSTRNISNLPDISLRIKIGGSTAMFIEKHTAKVGIGTTTLQHLLTVNGYTQSSGFVKTGSSKEYVLLGDGDHKAISDFSLAHSHPYLPLAGGTLSNSTRELLVLNSSNSMGPYLKLKQGSNTSVIGLIPSIGLWINANTEVGLLFLDEKAYVHHDTANLSKKYLICDSSNTNINGNTINILGKSLTISNSVNNYLTGVSGTCGGNITFTRSGLSSLTWNSYHSHDLYVKKYISVDDTSMNSYKESGFYAGYNMSNAAISGISNFLILKYSPDWGTLIQFNMNDQKDSKNGIYVRHWRNGGGVMDSSWHRLAWASEIPSVPNITSYYWANLNITSKAVEDSRPKFAAVDTEEIYAYGGQSLLAYKKKDCTGAGVDKFGVGSFDVPTVIRSNDSNLIHYRNGKGSYNILDSANSSVSKSGDTLTVKINGVKCSLTNTDTHSYDILYDSASDADSAFRNVGYGYAAQGWYGSGPAAVWGSSNGYVQYLQSLNDGNLYFNYKNPTSMHNWRRFAFADELPDVSGFVKTVEYIDSTGSTKSKKKIGTLKVGTSQTSVYCIDTSITLYTKKECTKYTSDDGACTPAAVKQAFSKFAPKVNVSLSLWGHKVSKLDENVKGDLYDVGCIYFSNNKTDIYGNMEALNQWHVSISNNTKLRVHGSGIDVIGNVSATGEVYAYSDRRLKSNIKPLENRGIILPVTFTKDGKKSIGFIALDMLKLYPELVIGKETENTYLSIDYALYTAVLQSLIIELKLEIKKLKELYVNITKQ